MHSLLAKTQSVELIEPEDRLTVQFSDWKLRGEDNQLLNFGTTKNKVVIINIWATWCPPCIAEMPSLEALYRDYGDKVAFLFVTTDDKELIQRFKSKNNYSFKVYYPINDFPEGLATKSIPRTFVLNKKREIIIDESGAYDWNNSDFRKRLDALLKD